MNKKKFLSGIVLAAGLMFSCSTTPNNAEAALSSNMQLVKGQIGEVTILQNTPLYKLGANNTMTLVRTLIKGSTYRVYAVSNFNGVAYYGVGAGYYVKTSSQVTYKTPSNLAEVNATSQQSVKSTSTASNPNNGTEQSSTPSPTIYIQLVKGQIGEVTILQNTPLYKIDSNQNTTFVRTLTTGSTYRVYTVSNFSGDTYYGVGAGYFVKASSQVKYVKVLDKITTEYPTINQLTDKELIISGKTEPGATVYISRNSVHVASFEADQTGYYFMPIALQYPGTVFTVYAKDSAGNWSHTEEATVSGQPRKASVIFSAPIVKQMPELPRGCEVTSLTMLLNYMGINVDKMTLAEQIKKDPTPYSVVDGKIHFGNPNVGFVGSMYTLNQRGYGVYNQPIEALARNYSSRIVNLSGQSFDSVLDYVSVGHPVWVITSYAYIPSQYWETWYTAQGPIQVTDWEHSVLITGYDGSYVYFNDPLTGTNKRKPINDVKAGWEQLGQQAISYY